VSSSHRHGTVTVVERVRGAEVLTDGGVEPGELPSRESEPGEGADDALGDRADIEPRGHIGTGEITFQEQPPVTCHEQTPEAWDCGRVDRRAFDQRGVHTNPRRGPDLPRLRQVDGRGRRRDLPTPQEGQRRRARHNAVPDSRHVVSSSSDQGRCARDLSGNAISALHLSSCQRRCSGIRWSYTGSEGRGRCGRLVGRRAGDVVA